MPIRSRGEPNRDERGSMKVGIVGAGVAGLSAAQALVTAGHDVVVFEKLRGPGGRVATRQLRAVEMPRGLAGATLAFDHGAFSAVMRGQPYPEAPSQILSGDGQETERWRPRELRAGGHQICFSD